MSLWELFIIAVGLSMDACAVSICKGLSVQKVTFRHAATCGGYFGAFQALMPVIGFFLGMLFAEAIQAIDHWVAFVLLGIIGISMLREAFSQEEESHDADLSVKTMFVMAVATSIDALAVGISLAMAGDVNIWAAIALIGGFTCAFCTVGVKIGNIFGSKLEDKAQIAGGVILILLGSMCVLEHLGILA